MDHLQLVYNHIPTPEQCELVKTQVSVIVKQCAKKNLFKSAGSLGQEVLTIHHATSFLPKTSNMERVVNRLQQKLRPEEPLDLDFALNKEHLPEHFLLGNIGVTFQHSNKSRHLLFASDSQLALLSRAKCWYIEATGEKFILQTPLIPCFCEKKR